MESILKIRVLQDESELVNSSVNRETQTDEEMPTHTLFAFFKNKNSDVA